MLLPGAAAEGRVDAGLYFSQDGLHDDLPADHARLVRVKEKNEGGEREKTESRSRRYVE